MTNLIGQSLGRYHILEQLGQGGMATVYKAYDTRLERDVAVKVIRVDQFGSAVLERILKRFEREAKVLAKLSHLHIIKIIDYGEHEGAPYLIMEYLPGGTLKTRLAQPMPWLEACKLLLPIAQALDYAHEQGLVHRDVKPSNILLTQKGQPMLTDFGIAKILETDEATALTGTGMGVGTPEYMAPEQWTGKTSPQTDIYALGVVFYEMVTGKKPYSADTPAAILLKQATEPLPRPSLVVPGLPEAVERVLFKALARQPEDRYASMGAFAAALERLAAGQPLPQAANSVVPEPIRQPVDSQATLDEMDALAFNTPTQNPVTPLPIRDSQIHTSQPARSPTPIFHFPFPISRKYWPIAAGLLGLVCLGALMTLLAGWLGNGSGVVLHATNTPAPFLLPVRLATFTPIPTLTSYPTPTRAPTWTPAFTATLELGIGSTQTREKDGMLMVYVPAGPFTMGSDNGSSDEKPVHTVTLDAYWIDRTEVTNSMYALCVQAGACQPPSQNSSYTRDNYYDSAQYADYPVIYVDWNQAKAYCGWVGGQLPSEAEWEKAARGTDGRTYPWGNQAPDQKLLNYNGQLSDTTAVGSYEAGKSPYGAYDMAGNVWEWVADWYGENYYSSSPSSNPSGPNSGKYRLLRGGSWYYDDVNARSALRNWLNPLYISGYFGFRCSRSK